MLRVLMDIAVLLWIPSVNRAKYNVHFKNIVCLNPVRFNVCIVAHDDCVLIILETRPLYRLFSNHIHNHNIVLALTALTFIKLNSN